MLGHAPWAPRTGHQCIAHNGKVVCIGGHAQGQHKIKQILMHDLWMWDPQDGIDGWKLVTDNVWGGADNPGRDGKSDFMIEVRDGKVWTFGGDREVMSPWPQDNDVWIAGWPAD